LNTAENSSAFRSFNNLYFERINYIPKRTLPLALLEAITFRPPLVFILTRKPWVLARLTFDG